jgi:hypothetical protein
MTGTTWISRPWMTQSGWLEGMDMSFDNKGGGGTTSLELALAWAFVGIPLLWGVYGTLVNALKLFQ